MNPDDIGKGPGEIGRHRVRQIFRFLKSFAELRNPSIRQIGEYPRTIWLRKLPNHPCVWVRTNQQANNVEEENGLLLRVRRPVVPDPPPLPEVLEGWLPPNWRNPSVKTVAPISRKPAPGLSGLSQDELFESRSERVRAFESWSFARSRWVEEALLAKSAEDVFEDLYKLHSLLAREGESFQLALGQGMLLWRRPEGEIRHPIIYQKLQLSFEPSIPEFKIIESEQPPELIRKLLTASADKEKIIQEADYKIIENDLDLLSVDQLADPLGLIATALDPRGQFLGLQEPAAPSEYPQIWCDPVIYLHHRNEGFSKSIEYILEDLQHSSELPDALLRVCGLDWTNGETKQDERNLRDKSQEVFFAKEANEEQIQIAERLNRHDNVIVQGPPGTGKTHTIANLIGHLLAQGKRILVTAHTSKALRVLRDKVVEPLQSLCVSVLDDEVESRKELEVSVEEMVARISRYDPDRLDREADAADAERKKLLEEQARLQKALIAARMSEYQEIVIAGEGTSPSEAARFVAEHEKTCSWIPGSVKPGAPLPLSEKEIFDLYETNVLLDPEHERELTRWIPALGEVPGSAEFRDEANRYFELQVADKETGKKYWLGFLEDTSVEELCSIERQIQDSARLLVDAPGWKLDAISAGMARDAGATAPWEELITRTEGLRREAQASASLLLDYRCNLGEGFSVAECRALAGEISSFLEAGGRITRFRLLLRPRWRTFIATVRVNDETPRTARQFKALEAYASLVEKRKALGVRWNNQITIRGGPKWEDFGPNPEAGAAAFVQQIQLLTRWQADQLSPLIERLKNAGFDWNSFIEAQPVAPGEHAELRRLISAVVEVLPAILSARIAALQLRALDRKFRKWRGALFPSNPNLLPATAVLDLRKAIDEKDYALYDAAFRCLVNLHELAPIYERRRELLSRLTPVAPDWASAIADRIQPHDLAEPPGAPALAWKWSQLNLELERRSEVSIEDLGNQIAFIRHSIRQLTARVIELRSWAAQCRRIDLVKRQALIGWQDIIRRIGRGTGRRAPGLRAEARRTLAKARDAVPVWIMPLSRVAETFDPRETRFDVVIVDEASQCDLKGLIAFYMGRQIVVVGDHEQVSPLAVGQNTDKFQELIDQYLSGIPNSQLYDGRMSLYDLARQSFGGVIRLVEHFRCVPEIIEFSNHLSYEGKIKPLREPGSTKIRPAVVAYNAGGVKDDKNVNVEEARTIAALLKAAVEQDEYKGKTFGALSLLGEEQAAEIDRLTRQILPNAVLADRQFLCGIPGQFQGDERDIVFISLVDSPGDGPLPLRNSDMYRQRFNVAASRAKDQLWVIHSLDYKNDLKPGDLRRRLIEYAQNPGSLLETGLQQERRTESEFERLVLRKLRSAGYRVTAQWPVGAYRIDLVVEGGGKRLAVECDGDRYHCTMERIQDDMERQAILERLGWRFVRIRGSQFFRNPDAAMKVVFETLKKMGIAPEGEEPPPQPSTDLLERVKRRANEILLQEFSGEKEWLFTGQLG